MQIHISTKDGIPIYKQIINQIRTRYILAGRVFINFFKCVEKKFSVQPLDICKYIFDYIAHDSELSKSDIIQKEHIDDVYWNNKVFKEISTDFIIDILKNVSESPVEKIPDAFIIE